MTAGNGVPGKGTAAQRSIGRWKYFWSSWDKRLLWMTNVCQAALQHIGLKNVCSMHRIRSATGHWALLLVVQTPHEFTAIDQLSMAIYLRRKILHGLPPGQELPELKVMLQVQGLEAKIDPRQINGHWLHNQLIETLVRQKEAEQAAARCAARDLLDEHFEKRDAQPQPVQPAQPTQAMPLSSLEDEIVVGKMPLSNFANLQAGVHGRVAASPGRPEEGFAPTQIFPRD